MRCNRQRAVAASHCVLDSSPVKSNFKFQRTVSFVVLALNEEEHIESTTETVLTAVQNSQIDAFEIVMVNDGSTDQTGALMESQIEKLCNAKVVHHETNKGLGCAYMSGIKISSMEYVMIIAGDNIMPASSISTIINCIGKNDMVLPFMTDDQFREPIRRHGSSGFTWVINKMSGNNIRYYNGMVVRRALFTGENIESTGYSLMAECVLKFLRKGSTYIEVGVPHGYPLLKKSNSKALQIKNLRNLFYSLIRIYKIIRQST